MRELTDDEFQNLNRLGKGRFTLLYSKIAELLPGKGLVIEKKDWLTKGPPYRVVRNVMNNTGRKFDFGRMPDGSGWWVKRLKELPQSEE